MTNDQISVYEQQGGAVMKRKYNIYDYLKENGIWHEITEHAAFFNMEELDALELP